jgi:phosphate transport system ATP-binding protein
MAPSNPVRKIDNPVLETRAPEDAKAPAPGVPKLVASGMNFFYGKFQALHDINIKIHSNRVTAFIGPSGCGKSTFLRTINRLNETVRNTRAEGEILLDNRDIRTIELSGNRRVGFSGIHFRKQFSTMSLWAARSTYASHGGVEGSGERSALASREGTPAGSSLLTTCSALDLIVTSKIEGFVLKKDCTIVIVTHNMAGGSRGRIRVSSRKASSLDPGLLQPRKRRGRYVTGR